MHAVVIFRSRLDPQHATDYERRLTEVVSHARSSQGYVGHKSFTADDGEELTLVEFEGLQDCEAWGAHPVHRRAQQEGRAHYYTEYILQVCELVRESVFKR